MLTQAGAKMSDLNSIELHYSDADEPTVRFRGFLERNVTPSSQFSKTIMPARTILPDHLETSTADEMDV